MRPFFRGANNKEYDGASRFLVISWWYSQLQNKENFYDALEEIIEKRIYYKQTGGVAKNMKSKNAIEILRENLEKFTEKGLLGIYEGLGKEIFGQIKILHENITPVLDSSFFGMVSQAIMLATIYENLKEIPFSIYEEPNKANQMKNLDSYKLWKPAYGSDGRIEKPKDDDLDDLDSYYLKDRIYTGGGGSDYMINWWYDVKPSFKLRDSHIEWTNSRHYFMNPPLGSMLMLITNASIRFNFILNSKVDSANGVSHWNWYGLTINQDVHSDTINYNQDIKSWIQGRIGFDKGGRLNIEYADWYSSDPFWECNYSGFVRNKHFIITFLNTDKSFASHFINWPISSPFI